MYYSPYNNKYYEKQQSIVNHVRTHAKNLGIEFTDIIQDYHKRIGTKPETCFNCKQQKLFTNLFGLSKCIDEACSKQRQLLIGDIRHRRKNSIEFLEYIRENLDYYREHSLQNNCFEPFFETSSGKISLKALIYKKLEPELLKDNCKCEKCGAEFIGSIIEPEYVCDVCRHPKLHRNLVWDENYKIYLDFINLAKYNMSLGVDKFLEFANTVEKPCLLFGEKPKHELHTFVMRSLDNIKRDIRYAEIIDNLLLFGVKTKTGLLHNFNWLPVNTRKEFISKLEEKFKTAECLTCGCKIDPIGMIRPYKHGKKQFCSVSCYKNRSSSGYCPPEMSDETREKHSIRVKSSILSGKFTPNISNRWTRRTIKTDSQSYRSSWEYIFHKEYPHLEYEKTRIRYFDTIQNKKRVYIVDFTDTESRILYEIKPENLMVDQEIIDKECALIDWCSTHGYTFKYVHERDIIEILKKHDLSFYSEVGEKVLAIIKKLKRKYDDL